MVRSVLSQAVIELDFRIAVVGVKRNDAAKGPTEVWVEPPLILVDEISGERQAP